MSEEQRPGSANVNVRQQRMELARQQYAERRRQSLQNLGMVMANENTTKTPETKSEESQETRPSSTSSQQSFQRMSSHESSAIESSKSKHDNLNTTGTYSVAEEDEEIESVPVVDSWRPPTSSSSRADSSVRIVGAGKPSDEDEDADAEHDAHRRTATQKKSEDEDDVFGVKSSKPRSDSSSDGRSSSASSAVNHEKDEAKRKAEIEKLMKEQGMDSAYVPKEVKPPPLVIDLSDIRTFLSKPAPKGGMIQCKVIRDKAGVEKLYPRYNFYLEKQDVFFMSARKRKKSKSSNYLLSLDAEDMGRDSGNYMGKVRSNFMGTEFVLFDKGENPKKSKETETPTIGPRQELGFMLYETNFLGMKGPRKMTIVIPAVREDGTRAIWKPSSSSDSMIDHYRRKDYRDMLILQNKAPTWHPESQSFVLNFRGRVTVASVKNFQLVAQGKVDDVLLQFGRVGEDQFTLDFQYPISPMQAFGIALSSFDGVSVSLPKKTLWMNSQSAENSRDLSGQVPKPLQDSIPFHEAGCTRGTCDTRFTYRNHKRILIDVVGEKWRRESMPKPEVKLPAGFQISLTIDDEEEMQDTTNTKWKDVEFRFQQ